MKAPATQRTQNMKRTSKRLADIMMTAVIYSMQFSSNKRYDIISVASLIAYTDIYFYIYMYKST